MPAPAPAEPAVLAAGPALEADLAAARARLPEGALLRLTGAEGLDGRRLVRALSEAGFLVLEPRRGEPAAGDWVARRERFVVRAYEDGDEHRILPLFRRQFHVERSLERWRWAFRDDPRGALRISLAFAPDGALVAQYAGYPVTFEHVTRAGRRQLTALQIGDTMTDPGYAEIGGKGANRLLGRTLRHFYAAFCEGRVAFNYGFNTGRIRRYSQSLASAHMLEPIPFHVLDLATRPPPPPGALRVERTRGLDARWDLLWDRAVYAYGFLVRRDSTYLQWRYLDCPDPHEMLAAFRGRELLGWGVFRRKEDRLLWGDALVDPREPQVPGQLLAAAVAANPGVRTVEAWVPARPAWWRWRMIELGFAPRPEPDDLAFMYVPFEFDERTELNERLHYTMGDSDLF